MIRSFHFIHFLLLSIRLPIILMLGFWLASSAVLAQHPQDELNPQFTRQDTLRGSVTPERGWWKLNFYHLDVEVFPVDSSLKGSVLIRYRVLKSPERLQTDPLSSMQTGPRQPMKHNPQPRMQIDLQPPMQITRVTQNGSDLKFERDGNAWFVTLAEPQETGALKEVKVFYQGKPRVSRRPPWDAAITWSRDKNGKPFVATACQGDGASTWWPCKDHMYEEPDSMLISVTTPGGLMDVSNGRLKGVRKNRGGTRTWTWFVSVPISNYVVNLNVGDYAHFNEVYSGEQGDLDCDYYVLKENLARARQQFRQVPMMLEAFEHWFGPYPFYRDGYKLVEVPYPGMEHQSSITYGNGYTNGFLGYDVSHTGWGYRYDYIIVHESAHEWFANNITYRDMADMWIHESFATYAEGLYVEYYFGKEAGYELLRGYRSNIDNDRPVIGYYDVNQMGSGDMYAKGANMLHTIRQLVDDDEKWRGILRGLNENFRYQVVTTLQIENYINENTELNLEKVFDQYLRDTRIPTLEYRFMGNKLAYRWTNCIPGFDMPVRVSLNGESILLEPGTGWKYREGTEGTEGKEGQELIIGRDFYVAGFNNMGE
jgi:aminopeptidase N